MQFNSFQYIAHHVQWLSILLFFLIYILVSQIVSSCKFSLTKFCECIPHFLLENHVYCTVILAYITLSLSEKHQILKLVCDFFFRHSCYFISCQFIFLFLLALQPIAGVFFTIFRWFIPVVHNYKNYKWYNFTNQTQHNLIFSIRSSKWQHAASFYSNAAIIRSSKDNL
jgi:hypothetical protein